MQSMVQMHRRTVLKTLLGAASAAAAPDPPPSRLVAWMYMIYPLEQWLTDYERTLDAWESGGVRGIVIGPLRFWDGTPSFDFTYARSGAESRHLLRTRQSISDSVWSLPRTFAWILLRKSSCRVY